jgi:DNA polymerase III alpha subunit
MIELAAANGVKCVLTSPSYMPDAKFYDVQKIMIENSKAGGNSGWHFPEPQALMTMEELRERARDKAPYLSDADFEQYCGNSMEVLSKCSAMELTFKPSLAEIDHTADPINADKTLESNLVQLEKFMAAKDAEFAELLAFSRTDLSLRTIIKHILAKKKIDIFKDEYRKRLTYELNVIQRNGVIRFGNYFHVIREIAERLAAGGSEKGPGRGSGAGSLVCYALDITDVDPIARGLDFDRFMTRERSGRFNFEVGGYKKSQVLGVK